MAKSKGFYGITGFALVLIVVIANSLGGSPYYLNKAHPTCYDDVDNDNNDPLNPKADWLDDDCLAMPFDFGAGEGAHADSPLGTGFYPIPNTPDPIFDAYAQTWNSSGNAYPTLYEFLTVHVYDDAPCGKSGLSGEPKYDIEFILNYWRNTYSISDDKTGYDQYQENCI
jgi:hypothetical protein